MKMISNSKHRAGRKQKDKILQLCKRVGKNVDFYKLVLKKIITTNNT